MTSKNASIFFRAISRAVTVTKTFFLKSYWLEKIYDLCRGQKRSVVGIVGDIARAKVQEGFSYYHVMRKGSHGLRGKFVLCATPRSGSVLLAHMLNSHPLIHCEFESLRFRPLFPLLFLEGRCATIKHEHVYGCKLMVSQSADIRYASFRKLLLDLHVKGWKIVALKRQNIFMQAISNYMAKATGRWTQRASGVSQAPERVYIDYEYFLRMLDAFERWALWQKQLLDAIPHLGFVYEDDLLATESHQRTADRVFSYLGLSSVPVQAPVAKILNKPFGEFIKNYVDICERVKHTQYAAYLSDISCVTQAF